jgi:biopolymer transport protein ExbB/TolQ
MSFDETRGFPLVAWARERLVVSADDLDVMAHKLLELPRVATRVAPMLGLVATMIPMGPALKALSDGNLAQVSDDLTVAFSAVILALIAAAITYWIVSVRRRWLAEELAWLSAYLNTNGSVAK